jgi:hypothetical protein
MGMVERLARLINPAAWEPLEGPAEAPRGLGRQLGGWNYQLRLRMESADKAREILAAMREPTEAMLDAELEEGTPLRQTFLDDYSETRVYQVMIDAALKD